MKDDDKYKLELEEKYIFGIIDKYEDYVFEVGNWLGFKGKNSCFFNYIKDKNIFFINIFINRNDYLIYLF